MNDLSIFDSSSYMSLTSRQKTFVREYLGDPVAAALKAGYKNPSKDAVRLMAHPKVRSLIVELDRMILDAAVMDRTAIMRTWSEWVRDEDLPMKYRIQASKLLAQARNLLQPQTQVNINNAVPVQVVVAPVEPAPSEAQELDRLEQHLEQQKRDEYQGEIIDVEPEDEYDLV